jgi:hypothetical protein
MSQVCRSRDLIPSVTRLVVIECQISSKPYFSSRSFPTSIVGIRVLPQQLGPGRYGRFVLSEALAYQPLRTTEEGNNPLSGRVDCFNERSSQAMIVNNERESQPEEK